VPATERPVVVIEDDPFLRIAQILLDPDASAERREAFADFFAHEEPDFDGYCARVRARAEGLFPATVRMVDTTEELRAALPGSHAVIVESLPVGREALDAAPQLRAVQKFGIGLRAIDTKACAARGVAVLTIRRRANIACAEHALALMLSQAKKLDRLIGRVTAQSLAAAGYPYRPFDRRHSPGSNWARIPGIRILHGQTLGIIGMGEIGREIALRANAFGMHVRYFQRSRLPEAEEQQLGVRYAPLEELLGESDWIVPQLPSSPGSRGLLDRDRLAQVKPGAFIVNIARADVIDRAALVEALRSGRLGGFALDPLYEAPMREDDELLALDNVILTPHIAAQPRFNALDDLADMVVALAREFRP
jgi:phosphoglycerate dehydrogenase-like enzyme